MTVRRETDAVQMITQTQFDPRLPCHGDEKSPGPVEQLAKIDRRALRSGQAMEVQNIVDGGGQGSQSSLHLLDPPLALRRQPRSSQQSGKQLQAADRKSV